LSRFSVAEKELLKIAVGGRGNNQQQDTKSLLLKTIGGFWFLGNMFLGNIMSGLGEI
jgi:hypothetical protein